MSEKTHRVSQKEARGIKAKRKTNTEPVHEQEESK